MSKIKDIIFTDENKTMINIAREDGSFELHTWQPQSKSMIDLEGWTETDIEESTVNFNIRELEAREKMNLYFDALGQGKFTQMNLLEIISKEWSKEELFELKLAIFELPEVKEFKGRKEKSAMRKSVDLVEILHYLYLIRNPE